MRWLAATFAILVAAAPVATQALAQIEVERPPALEGAWWARWVALLLIVGAASAICFKNPKRGHDQ